MNQNSLLALVTLIALLWINRGDCQKEAQNENEVLNRGIKPGILCIKRERNSKIEFNSHNFRSV